MLSINIFSGIPELEALLSMLIFQAWLVKFVIEQDTLHQQMAKKELEAAPSSSSYERLLHGEAYEY